MNTKPLEIDVKLPEGTAVNLFNDPLRGLVIVMGNIKDCDDSPTVVIKPEQDTPQMSTTSH